MRDEIYLPYNSIRREPVKFTANFPMYNFSEMRGALDIIWKSLARQLERVGSEI